MNSLARLDEFGVMNRKRDSLKKRWWCDLPVCFVAYKLKITLWSAIRFLLVYFWLNTSWINFITNVQLTFSSYWSVYGCLYRCVHQCEYNWVELTRIKWIIFTKERKAKVDLWMLIFFNFQFQSLHHLLANMHCTRVFLAASQTKLLWLG